ncbi:MAG TPA: 4Fe-4S dicluster domain-containing protein [Terriglobia bacterium]|nr:4Fe-4S dicluster domain-containing protein [Terriglobia bacterium]
MPKEPAPLNVSFVLELTGFEQLLQSLRRRGYRIIGPRARDGAIVYDELTTASDLPIGWTDEQEGGTYRLKKRNDQTLFGFSVGPHSWKQFFHPPAVRLWQVTRDANGFKFQPETLPGPKLALLGVRSCELHAIAIQDKVFLNGVHVDSAYRARRENAFLIAVNCGQAGGTCFCVSMNTGPKATAGYDLVLTEVCEAGRHYFLIEAGSRSGAQVLGEAPCRPARPEENQAASRVVENTARQMGRRMDTVDLKDLLYRNYENPRWDEVASRCLTCANCTMVCPTCFCTTVEDVTDLKGEVAERWQKWDSCFTTDFSYIHGGSVRTSAKSRYRQWMTHKLATWIDQFGTSGCVGCGRCITWCPVAIDITEEVRALRQSETANSKPGKRK